MLPCGITPTEPGYVSPFSKHFTRKLIFGKISKRFKKGAKKKEPYIEGDYEEIKDEDDRKV